MSETLIRKSMIFSCNKFQFKFRKDVYTNLSQSRVFAPVVNHCYLIRERREECKTKILEKLFRREGKRGGDDISHQNKPTRENGRRRNSLFFSRSYSVYQDTDKLAVESLQVFHWKKKS